MPSKDARAAAEGMPAINRRRLMMGLAAASTAVVTPAAAAALGPVTGPAAMGDDTALFALVEDYNAATAKLVQSKDELDWILAEWRHLWPLAPEEILGGANAQTMCDTAERDLAGNFVFRECAPLTNRLSRRFRSANSKTCFSLDAAEQIESDLTYWRAHPARGRTEKSRARNARFKAKTVEQLQKALVKAREYEAETARIRTLSGIEAARERVTFNRRTLTATADLVLSHPATTIEGVAAKVSVFEDCPLGRAMEHSGGFFAFGWSIAKDLRRVGLMGQEGGAV